MILMRLCSDSQYQQDHSGKAGYCKVKQGGRKKISGKSLNICHSDSKESKGSLCYDWTKTSTRLYKTTKAAYLQSQQKLPFQGTGLRQLFATLHQKDSQLLDPSIAQFGEASSHLNRTGGAYKNHVSFDVANASRWMEILD